MAIKYLDAKRIQGTSVAFGSSADGTLTSGITLDTTNEKIGTGCLDFSGASSQA